MSSRAAPVTQPRRGGARPGFQTARDLSSASSAVRAYSGQMPPVAMARSLSALRRIGMTNLVGVAIQFLKSLIICYR